MIRFNNDYNHMAHPKVLELLMEERDKSYGGYGEDEWCEKAADVIRSLCHAPEAAVYFFPGATQANFIVHAAALSPIESVICADTGHVFCHETGSIENTGHKLLALPNRDGKISAAQIEKEAAAYYDDEREYLTRPRLVYLSFSTESGTVYTKRELEDISAVCRKYGLRLFVDGARMGYGLGAAGNELTLADFVALTDVFYIGGTKCGALFGEALVITDPALRRHFKSYMKQNGAVLAKGWLLGLQFYALLHDGTYFTITKRADALAMRVKDAFRAKGIPFWVDSPTNQQFVFLTDAQKEALAARYVFEEEFRRDDGLTCVRFCTSWSSTEEEIDALTADIAKL